MKIFVDIPTLAIGVALAHWAGLSGHRHNGRHIHTIRSVPYSCSKVKDVVMNLHDAVREEGHRLTSDGREAVVPEGPCAYTYRVNTRTYQAMMAKSCRGTRTGLR